MKGISEVIALILMLVITIALAGTAYLYISGIFTTQTQGIEVSDAFCTPYSTLSPPAGNITMTIRNLGTSPVTAITCAQIAPAGGICGASSGSSETGFNFPGGAAIAPGQSLTWASLTLCNGTGTRTCQYRLTANIGRTITTQVTCS